MKNSRHISPYFNAVMRNVKRKEANIGVRKLVIIIGILTVLSGCVEKTEASAPTPTITPKITSIWWSSPTSTPTAMSEVPVTKTTSNWLFNSSMGNKQILVWANEETGDTKIRVITLPTINGSHAANPISSPSEIGDYYDIIINRDEKSLRTEGKVTTPVKITIEEYSGTAATSSINTKAVLFKKDGLTVIGVIDENEKIIRVFIPEYSLTEISTTKYLLNSTIDATSSINTKAFLTKDGLIYVIEKSGTIIQVAIPDGYNLTDGSRSLIAINLWDKNYRLERRKYDKGGNLIELGYDTYKVEYKYSTDFFPKYPVETIVVPNIIESLINAEVLEPVDDSLRYNRSAYVHASELFYDCELAEQNLSSNSKIYVFLYINLNFLKTAIEFNGSSSSLRFKDDVGNVIAQEIGDKENNWLIVMKGKNYSTGYVRPFDKTVDARCFERIRL